jgi:hypothetical protein
MSMLDHAPARSAATQFQTLTAVSVAFMAVGLVWSVADPRLIDGVPVWSKPLKFAVSFVVLFGTLALLERRLSRPVREGRPLRLVGWVMAAAFLSEMAWIGHQAARAEGSHFNLATPLSAFMYLTVMAAGAVALVACIGVVGWIARRDSGADLEPATREGVWLGFLASFVLTMIVAGTLSAGTGPMVGIPPEGARTLPLLGWSGAVGDLRPAHFLSLHAMQALPLLGLWLDRSAAPGGIRTVRIAALGYAALTFAVFAQGLAGLPLIPLG